MIRESRVVRGFAKCNTNVHSNRVTYLTELGPYLLLTPHYLPTMAQLPTT
jgi:hypothetical protein